MLLFAATSNSGKMREFALAAADLPDCEIAPLPGFRELPAVEESGTTFEENARIKAVHYSGFTGELVFAEDSGLVVDALDGAPGVYSARFAGGGASDAANNHLLLERLRGAEDRTAHFECVIALARQGNVLATFEGSMEGSILHEPRGTSGFGYDPLFFHAPCGRTTAELTAAEKFPISHRGQAFRALLRWLNRGDGARL
ncbi:MAG: RdgB/HAM1 family non-canonical purine NTP pyrophosphatase [Bryobacterales bacterium]|nr:RdgB/HAM1 family non-canonical purine NTP pyrophosphatase [Bryobacterales bacterium]